MYFAVHDSNLREKENIATMRFELHREATSVRRLPFTGRENAIQVDLWVKAHPQDKQLLALFFRGVERFGARRRHD